jgi:hypothetical protein
MIMHNKLIVSSLLLTAFALPITVLAGTSNDVPSCYAANKLPAPAQAERELFVLVDQTTTFDAKLQANIRENLGRLIKPGVAFVIADFSSFGQGKYAEIVSGE